MSQSGTQSGNQDLIYDNTAFGHFMVSISVLTTAIMALSIIKQIWDWKKSCLYRKLEKNQIFNQKVSNSSKFDKLTQSKKPILTKAIILIISMLIFYFYFSSLGQGQQLVGFDPYQILNVEFGASELSIKKSYRKLALQFHPDRRKDGQGNKKFILISKAYKCLTDKQSKENFLKYGHPDGEKTYKIGIGLPSFMISGGSIYTLVIILTILLVVTPSLFFKWAQTAPVKRSEDKQIRKLIYNLMNPHLNSVSCCIIYGCMTQLNYLFKQSEILYPEEEKQFKKLLLSDSSIDQKLLNGLTPHILFKIKCIYDYISKKNNDYRIVYQMPKICQKLLHLSFVFGKRPLNISQIQSTNRWFGLILTKRIIQFCQQIFNRISTNQFSKCLNNLKQLPNIHICARITVQGKQIHQMTIDEVAYLHIKIKKQIKNYGFVICQQHPFITEQKFILLVYQNSNLLSTLVFEFKEQKCQVLHSFKVKKIKRGHSNISISLYSASYPTILLQRQLSLYIYERIEKRRIKIHQEDRRIDSIPKNFFEKLLTVYDNSISDQQLSQGQEQKAMQFSKKKKKIKSKNQRKLKFRMIKVESEINSCSGKQ